MDKFGRSYKAYTHNDIVSARMHSTLPLKNEEIPNPMLDDRLSLPSPSSFFSFSFLDVLFLFFFLLGEGVDETGGGDEDADSDGGGDALLLFALCCEERPVLSLWL